jgi:hypothetical protein
MMTMMHRRKSIIENLGCYILLVQDPIISYQPYLVRSRSRQALFTRSVIMHSCDLLICLQAMSMQYHRESPEYIFPSSGQTNPNLDP